MNKYFYDIAKNIYIASRPKPPTNLDLYTQVLREDAKEFFWRQSMQSGRSHLIKGILNGK